MRIKLYFISVLFWFCFCFPTLSQPTPNPVLDSILMNLPPDRVPYVPFFLNKFDPIKVHSMDRNELLRLFNVEFPKFILDSGWKFIPHEPIFVYPGENRFTPELLLTLKRVGKPKVSPNGKYLLYSVGKPNIRENLVETDLFLLNLESGATENLTNDPQFNEFDYQWDKSGKFVYFISTSSTEPQVFRINVETRERKQITNSEKGVKAFKVSPDGQLIAYASDVKIFTTPKEKYPFLDKAKVRIYETLPVRHWDTWEDEYKTHIFISSVEGGTPVDLMSNEPFDAPDPPFGGSEQFDWSPDSKELAYTCKKEHNYATSTNTNIYVYNLETKKTLDITANLPGYDKNPKYSPDGKWIAFHSQKRPGFESDRVRLMLYNRLTNEITELSWRLDQWVGEFIWNPTNPTKIYFSAEDGPVVQIYEIDITDGFWRILSKGYYNNDGGLDISSDGQTLFFGRRNMLRPFEIYKMSLINPNYPIMRLTFENEDIYRQLKTVRITERWIKSRDGKKIHTWVIFPPDFDEKKKYPMIVYCQGGPQSTISQYFSYRWNLFLFASQGYIVVAPNRRGVPGFGQEWNDAISKDWGGKPMEDILDVTDSIRKEPFVNKSGVAAVGASAGGYAVFWLAGNHQKRFSAFLSHCGVFNLESKYGSTEELWFPNWEFGGPFWEPKAKAIYEKHSPHKYVQNWDTPIMISAGEKDFRVPYTQSLEAFTAAKLKGLPAKLMIFPQQGHWILKPQEQILWYYEVFEFLDKYCKKD
ncbi:MAG: S9 family peptidase [Ignavibacteria bacterium]|nr:S9 family peptidase [Ignavibacteria bacterium]